MKLKKVTTQTVPTALIWIISLSALALPACAVDPAKRHYILAEKLWADGKHKIAVKEFEKVVAVDPKGRLGLQARYRAAMTYSLFLDNHTAAIQHFRTYILGISNRNKAWEAKKAIGNILYERIHNYEEAIRHFDLMIEERPLAREIPEILHRKGRAHFLLREFDKSISAYRRLLKTFPRSEMAENAAYEVGLTFYTRGEQNPRKGEPGSLSYQNAIDAFQIFIKNFPDSTRIAEAKFGIGSALEELDQLDAAIHQYEEIIETYPSPNVVKIKITRIEQRQRRLDQ